MLKQILLMSMGITFFILGIILLPILIPLGIPFMIIGLSFMMKTSNQVKRLAIRLVNKNRHSNQLWRKTRDLHKRIRNK